MTDAAWAALLDRFESDLTAETPAPWSRPDTPLPAASAARARVIVQRQQDRLSAMRSELDELRAQIQALRRIPAVRGDAPVLLDRNL